VFAQQLLTALAPNHGRHLFRSRVFDLPKFVALKVNSKIRFGSTCETLSQWRGSSCKSSSAVPFVIAPSASTSAFCSPTKKKKKKKKITKRSNTPQREYESTTSVEVCLQGDGYRVDDVAGRDAARRLGGRRRL
jgi:hypothetical protein